MEELQKELATVKEQARKWFEKSRDSWQMEAAAMFLAQVERLLTSKIWLETLLAELGKTDPMPEYPNMDDSGNQWVPPRTPGVIDNWVIVKDKIV